MLYSGSKHMHALSHTHEHIPHSHPHKRKETKKGESCFLVAHSMLGTWVQFTKQQGKKRKEKKEKKNKNRGSEQRWLFNHEYLSSRPAWFTNWIWTAKVIQRNPVLENKNHHLILIKILQNDYYCPLCKFGRVHLPEWFVWHMAGYPRPWSQ